MKVADQHRFSAVTAHLHSGESRVTTPSVLIALTLLPRSGLVQYLFRDLQAVLVALQAVISIADLIVQVNDGQNF